MERAGQDASKNAEPHPDHSRMRTTLNGASVSREALIDDMEGFWDDEIVNSGKSMSSSTSGRAAHDDLEQPKDRDLLLRYRSFGDETLPPMLLMIADFAAAASKKKSRKELDEQRVAKLAEAKESLE